MSGNITNIPELVNKLKDSFSGPNSSTFDVYNFNSDKSIPNYKDGFKDLFGKQLSLTGFSIETSNPKAVTTGTVGGKATAAAIIQGKITSSPTSILKTADQNLSSAYIYFWIDGDQNIQGFVAFQLKVDQWTFGTSLPSLADESSRNQSIIFENLVAADHPLILLSTAKLEGVDCQKIIGGSNTYPQSTEVENLINIFFSTSFDAELQELYPVLAFLAKLTGISIDASISFEGTIDLSDQGLPIIDIKGGFGKLTGISVLSSVASALNAHIGFLTEKVTPPESNGQTEDPFVTTEIAFYITVPIGSQSISFQSILSLDAPSLLGIDMLEGQEISLTDIGNIFTAIAPSSLTNEVPDTFKTAITDNIKIDKFGFSINLSSKKIPILKIGFDITPPNNGVLVDGLLAFNDVFLDFIVKNPFETTKSFTTLINGTLDLLETSYANISYNASYDSAPDAKKLSIGGGLIEGKKLSFDTLSSSKEFSTLEQKLKAFSTTIYNDIASIEIDAFGIAFNYDFVNKNYDVSFNLKVEPSSAHKWQIGNTGPELTALEIEASFSKEGSSGQSKEDVSLSVEFDIDYPVNPPAQPGSNGAATVILSGEYDTGEWSFHGGLGGGGLTGYDIVYAFGASAPGWLNKLDLIDLTVDYASGKFELTMHASLTFSQPILFALTLTEEKVSETAIKKQSISAAQPSTSKTKFTVDGKVTISKLILKIKDSGETGSGNTFTAELMTADKSQSILTDIADIFGLPTDNLKAISKELDITDVTFEYSSAGKDPAKEPQTFALGITDTTYGKFVVAGIKPGTSWLTFFDLDFTKGIDFSGLPVVGHFIKDHGGFSISPIQLIIIPQAITAKQVTLFKIPEDYPQMPAAGEKGLPKGPIIIGTVKLDGQEHTFTLGYSAPDTEGESSEPKPAGSWHQQIAAAEESSASSAPTATTQQVGKSFGPVTIQKFSPSYSKGRIDLDISGSLTLGGIALIVEGMSIGIPFPFDNKASFSFGLKGMGVDVQEGALTIAGGFLEVAPKSYMGAVNIQVAEFGLQAYGGYADESSGASFFIFVNAKFPIGGPPFFFLDGVAGGLGINRAFKLPTTFKELENYPLLPGTPAIPTSVSPGSGGMDQLEKALQNLANYIYPEKGNYWAAAGLDVTSFEMINLEAVLSVSFGVSLEVALIATANMTLPVSEDPDPLAYIAINFLIAIEPDKGFFTAMGVLTPASYVFSGLAKISGGFAFDIWFKGEHEGNFVVSIGGYNPRFQKPDIYPSVPRLMISWGLGPFHITGQSYFALTPRMMMAGLEIDAGWHGGPVSVSFSAGIDFMIGWKPFFYEADAFIRISGSVHLLFTITIHVSADLNVWGPSFGGKAHVHLSIISFTIHFGSDKPTPPPLTWKEFQQLIPNTYPKADDDKKDNAPQLAPMVMAASPDATPKASDNKPIAVSSIQLSKGALLQHSSTPLTLSNATINMIQGLIKASGNQGSVSNAQDKAALDNNTQYNWVLDPNHFQLSILSKAPLTNFTINSDQYNFKDGLTSFINASKIVYLTNPVAFYANPPSSPPPSWYKPRPHLSGKLAIVYDTAKPGTEPWWTANDNAGMWWDTAGQLGVAPMDIVAGKLESSLRVELSRISNEGGTLQLVEEAFVVKLVTKNVAGSMWSGDGSQIANLNDKPTVRTALVGFQIMPPIWSPEQTKSINIYLLVFQQNDLIGQLDAAPTPADQSFKKHDSSYENEASLTVKEAAFNALSTSAGSTGVMGSLSKEFPNLSVSATAADLATIGYEALPILSTLGNGTSNLQSN